MSPPGRPKGEYRSAQREGTPVNAPTPSRVRRAPGSMTRLIGISCVGNEADIVEAFVRHHATLLDHLVILEHNTLDGTREILDRLVAEGLPISVEHSTERKHLQVAFTNRLLRVALTKQRADWVFPLDCDEFLVVPTRADLDAALMQAGPAHGRIKSINYVPSPADDVTEPHPLLRIRHCYDYPAPSVDENPWAWKIAVNARFLGDYYLTATRSAGAATFCRCSARCARSAPRCCRSTG